MSTDQNEERLTKIIAYLGGELSNKETDAFEEEIRADEGLRREVETCRVAIESGRAWVQSPPPGIDRAKTLPVPKLAGAPGLQSRRNKLSGSFLPFFRTWALRAGAMAAVFAVGFYVGHTNQPAGSQPAGIPPSPVESSTYHPTSTEAVTPPESQPPTELPDQVRVARDENLFFETPIREAREVNGRLVIETTLKNHGSQATWVVDRRFQMHSESKPQPQKS